MSVVIETTAIRRRMKKILGCAQTKYSVVILNVLIQICIFQQKTLCIISLLVLQKNNAPINFNRHFHGDF